MLPLYLLRPGTWFRFAEQYNDPGLYEAQISEPFNPFNTCRVRLVGQNGTALSHGCSLVEIFNR